MGFGHFSFLLILLFLLILVDGECNAHSLCQTIQHDRYHDSCRAVRKKRESLPVHTCFNTVVLGACGTVYHFAFWHIHSEARLRQNEI